MSDRDIWEYFVERSVSRTRMLARDIVWVTRDDFRAVERHFFKDINIFHPRKSYRSRRLFRHLHAIEQGEYVLVHRDTGNLSLFPPLGVVHLIFDVLPHAFVARRKRVPMRALFSRPEQYQTPPDGEAW